MKERILALAALVQAVEQVTLMANQGQAQTDSLAPCINGLFVFDADSSEQIYGNRHQLKPGLSRLYTQLQGETHRDNALTRIALNVLNLERQFAQHEKVMFSVREHLQQTAIHAKELGATHPEILSQLGKLYADKVSPLGQKIMVQGNPVYLAQSQVVLEVRASLLAAVRAAHQWRYVGGTYWDFFISRGKMTNSARELQGLI